MDTAAIALRRVEAVEARAARGSRSCGDGTWARTWRPEPPGALTARGSFSRSPALSFALPTPTSTRSAFHIWRSGRLLNQPNRRVRTRTHGGVTGKAREGLPMSIAKSGLGVQMIAAGIGTILI